jgi:glycosyltransferase involved in cell wall biosynthesis
MDCHLSHNPILFVVNAPEFFLSHRLPLGLALQKEGYKVHVASADGPELERIRQSGFEHHSVPFDRSGQNLWVELKTLFALACVYRRVRPALIHLVTIKPVLYGGLLARILGVRAVVSAVSGLGTVFLAQSPLEHLRRWMVALLYKLSLGHKNTVVVFQNPHDRDALLSMRCLKNSQVRLIRGSGVELPAYPYKPEPEGPCIVVMAARLLKDKGVYEYVGAARLLHQRGANVEMRLIGAPDLGNPTSIKQHDLDRWRGEGYINVMGFRADIAEQYAAANVVCLPSYREGLPKSLVEAAACGRAVVTTDVPGCRDAITPNVTGVLVPVQSAESLANAIELLAKNTELRMSMGRAGRALAESSFAIEKIVQNHMDIYNGLLNKAAQ